MQDLPIFPTDWKRDVAKESELPLRNRFVEENPALNDSQVSMIARPGLNRFLEVGTGHVRKVFSEPGVFNGDAFVVSGTNIYRIDRQLATITDLGTISSSPDGDVSMAATSPIGTNVPAYLFIAEGQVLWFYTDNGHARGQLEATGTITNGDVVEMDGVYYQWTSGSVDTGTPAGTVGSPWLVNLGISNSEALNNLQLAIGINGVEGLDYSTGTVEHSTIEVLQYTANDLFIQVKSAGVLGNGKSLTETGAGLSWTAATTVGGGDNQLSQVSLPDDAGAISVAHINSFVIVVPVQFESLGTIGRFYWIEPGERIIDPLNFATAERSPDRINQVVTFSDMFWLFGDTTTEPWVTTGSPDAPMQRFQGIIFDRGSWEGTAVKIRDSMIVVDEEGSVFLINNGQRRISNHSIEERIRKSIQIQTQRLV